MPSRLLLVTAGWKRVNHRRTAISNAHHQYSISTAVSSDVRQSLAGRAGKQLGARPQLYLRQQNCRGAAEAAAVARRRLLKP